MTSNRRGRSLIARRAGGWIAWWALLLAFWVVLDYSAERDELLAGSAAAALGAAWPAARSRPAGSGSCLPATVATAPGT
jgi:hypothetical protein